MTHPTIVKTIKAIMPIKIPPIGDRPRVDANPIKDKSIVKTMPNNVPATELVDPIMVANDSTKGSNNIFFYHSININANRNANPKIITIINLTVMSPRGRFHIIIVAGTKILMRPPKKNPALNTLGLMGLYGPI